MGFKAKQLHTSPKELEHQSSNRNDTDLKAGQWTGMSACLGEFYLGQELKMKTGCPEEKKKISFKEFFK